MLIVGLTGGIGSGKSTVAAEFAALGVPVIDTDHLAHALSHPPSPALWPIQQRFGRDALLPDGSLNRTFLRDQVFADPEARADLESIMHPLILDDVRDWLADLPASTDYAVVVIPLLFEKPRFQALVQRTIAIDCDEQEQIRRVMLRSGLSAEAVRAIIAAQMPAERRRALADDVINNNQNTEALRPFVEKLHQKLVMQAKTPV